MKELRRVLVGIAPVRIDGQRKPTPVPFSPAVVFWHGEGEDMVSVIVKATISLRGSGDRAFVKPRPWVASYSRDDDPIKRRGYDFVPAKDLCDVMLTGHIELAPTSSGLPFRPADGSRPLIHANVMVRAPGASVNFTVSSSGAGRVPLVPPYVSIGGEGVAEIGPRLPRIDPAAEGFRFERGFDYEPFQLANPRLQSEHVGPGAEISIEGLGPEMLVVKLPSRFPHAVIDWTRTPFPSDARLRLDTVHVDLDAEVVDLTWRGFTIAGPSSRRAIDRVVIGFLEEREIHDSTDPKQKYRRLYSELPRGTFQYAWEMSDVIDGTAPPAIPEEEFEMARFEALGNLDAPAPTLDLREHALVSAELLEVRMTPGLTMPAIEERQARAAVLEKYDLDEFTWSIEERSHGDRLAAVPSSPEDSLHVQYSRLFIAAQERLAPPGEALPTPKDYAITSARLQVEQPRDVLHDAKLSLGAWMRIDRKYQQRMAVDEKLREEIDGYLEAQGTERGEPKVPDVDDEGVIR